jgi:hypothetical protein
VKLLRRQGREAAKVLQQAASLEEAGRSLEALDLLLESNRRQPSPEVETRLVQIRNRAFDELGAPGSSYAEPAATEFGAAAEDDGIPSLEASRLSAGAIRSAFLSHGSLLVRGLCPPDVVETLREGIDKAFEQRDANNAGAPLRETTPWFNPFRPDPRFLNAVELGRRFVGDGSGIWTADSPRMLFKLLEAYEDSGVRRVVSEYLGERPAISVNKGTLRRAQPTVGTEWWHQDGAFLGEGIRSLNIWLALTDCGVDAPGLEVVPQRIDQIVEKGTRGADFGWSVGQEVVDEVSGGVAALPVFRAGDAMLFDHLCLHRTGSTPSMTKTRYATETWFFAPSAYPDPQTQVPLAY